MSVHLNVKLISKEGESQGTLRDPHVSDRCCERFLPLAPYLLQGTDRVRSLGSPCITKLAVRRGRQRRRSSVQTRASARQPMLDARVGWVKKQARSSPAHPRETDKRKHQTVAAIPMLQGKK